MKKIVFELLAMLVVLGMLVSCGYIYDSDYEENESVSTESVDEKKTEDTESETDDIHESEVNTETEDETESETESVSDDESGEDLEDLYVPLHELSIISDDVSLHTSSVKDSYGNKYDGPYYDFCSWGDSYEDDEYITQSYIEYNVEGKYRYLTGTVFTRKNQDEDHSIELLVYADDELIFQSEPMTRRDKAFEFAVDIGNCEVLRITSRTYESSSNTNPGIILVNGFVCNEFNGDLTEGVEINNDLVPLTDLYVYGDHSKVLDNIDAGVVKDSYGNIYKGIYLELVSYGDYGGVDFDTQAYTDFVTDGDYKYFSGTFFTRKGQAENYSIEFLIYADDELVYSSGMIDRSTKAVDFCVDINECDMLRVMSRSVNYTDSGTNPGIILVDAVVSTEKP